MKDIINIEKELKNKITESIDTRLNSSLSDDFSWEMFFKFSLWNDCLKFITEKILSLTKEDTIESKEKLKEIYEFTKNESEMKNYIEKQKENLLKNGKLKIVVITDYNEKIETFFNQKRNVNYSSLSKEEKYELLRKEDITSHDKKSEEIFHLLNVTHMQYKYLYQNGSCLI